MLFYVNKSRLHILCTTVIRFVFGILMESAAVGLLLVIAYMIAGLGFWIS